MDIWTLLLAIGCCVVVARAFDSLGAMIPGSSWGGLYVAAGRAVAIVDDRRPGALADAAPRTAAATTAGTEGVIEDGTRAPTPTQRVRSSPPRWHG